MPTKIVVSGRYLSCKDLKYLNNGSDIEIVVYPKLQDIANSEVECLHKDAKNADLLIVALFGSDVKLLPKLKIGEIGVKKGAMVL